MKTFLFALLLLVPSILCATDETLPEDVEVVANDNAASARVAYALKEKIRASRSFRLVSSNVQRIRISISALPVSSDINASAVAVTWTSISPLENFQVYLHTNISIVPNPRINEAVDMIMSGTDKAVGEFRHTLTP